MNKHIEALTHSQHKDLRLSKIVDSDERIP